MALHIIGFWLGVENLLAGGGMHILQGADVLQADGHDVSQGFPSQIN